MGILNAGDMIDIGIEKEKKRRDFYAIAAGKFASNLDLAALFTRLKEWEDEHVERFAQIRDSVANSGSAETFPGETEAYMRALVESDLYDEITPEGFANLVDSQETAIKLGIRFEKDAILFFSALLKYLDDDMKPIVRVLMEEEQQHMVYLDRIRMEIEGKYL